MDFRPDRLFDPGTHEVLPVVCKPLGFEPDGFALLRGLEANSAVASPADYLQHAVLNLLDEEQFVAMG